MAYQQMCPDDYGTLMKILHITPAYEPAWHLGGVVGSVSQLTRGLSRLGHEVTVFTTDSGGDRRLAVPVNQPIDKSGVTVYYFNVDFFLKFFYSTSLTVSCSRMIREFEILHLTAFWNYPGIVGGYFARKANVPYLVSVHGTLREAALQHKSWKKWPYFQVIEKRNIRGAAAIHYTTAMERELDSFHCFSNPSFIVPNGFTIDEFQTLPKKKKAKESLGVNPHTKVITFLGRLDPIKNLHLLLEAMSNESLRKEDCILILAGPDCGAERSLKRLALHYGHKPQLKFMGPVDPEARLNLLAASDLLVLVSQHENFGNAAVEAMLAGVPVLLSEQVGICREVAADGAGVVVPLTVEAVSDGLVNMLADPEKLAAMGSTAAASARSRYNIDIVARQMAKAYEDILAGRRSPGLNWSNGEQMCQL
jgi:glycosyltransferase involved in cell wall biosynthesis